MNFVYMSRSRYEFPSSYSLAAADTLQDEMKLMREKLDTLKTTLKNNTNLTDANSWMNEMFSLSGWFRASNNLIYKRFTDSVNYATAKAQCEEMGARLVSTGIRDNKVKIEIFPKHYLAGVSAWIGLDDIRNEGIWVWSDGVNESPNSLWDAPEPNGGRTENCVEVVFYNSTFVGNDAPCTLFRRFVCEREVN
ncbi:lectin-like [Styela clava]